MSREELEKLTATKLREIAEEYPDIQGAHAMKKDELVIAILKARGEPIKVDKKDAHIGDVKKEIRTLRKEQAVAKGASDRKKTAQLRKKIKKLKRQTRHLASQKKK
jgi:hypothetical protein